jgi:hypothetical protein
MSDQSRTLLVASACFLSLVLNTSATYGMTPEEFSVQVTAQVQITPAQITLRWPSASAASHFLIRRKLKPDHSWGAPLAQLPGNARWYADTSVVLGAPYEYQIERHNLYGPVAYGYICAGMEVPFPGARGRVVLIVDNTHSGALAGELARLQLDLAGDGWEVLRHDVAPSASPPEVKSLVKAAYLADPANTQAVFLIGRVPVPYSGAINPDMHATHSGAWPADVYYGDMNGVWTDHTVNSTSGEDPRNHNRPGDGKFDQSIIPAEVKLQVGRVDFSNLPAFAPRTERDLLRQYLNKNHQFRHKIFEAGRRGLIRDNFGVIEEDAPATDAWRNFTPFFGLENIRVVSAGEYFPALDSASYLWSYAGGGGGYFTVDGVGSTSDFVNRQPRCVFYMLHGSYFGDWDTTDNFLRASLASSGYGLAAAWTGLPHWYAHHMALGETIGFSARATQNNRDLYRNHLNLSAGEVHIALMGDPTLRMHVVAPPANLVALPNEPSAVTLYWNPSRDAVRGYYVYRAPTPAGPFSRLTRGYLTESTFTDNAAPAGPKTYMVRAVRLETSASGTYYNPSQGAFVTVGEGNGTVLPTVSISADKPEAHEAGSKEGSFVISRTAPLTAPLQVSFSVGGTASNGIDYQQIANSATIPAGASALWVTIRPLPDDLVEGDESVILTLVSNAAYNIGSPASATMIIKDNPPVNQPPSLTAIPDQTILANTSTPPLPFSVSDAETPAGQLTVSGHSSNPDLVDSLGMFFGGTGANRSLTITPAREQAGTATITVVVSDGQSSAQRQFQLAVLPVNLEPALSIVRGQNGATTLHFSGPAGGAYAVQASIDLESWITLVTGTATSTSPIEFQDPQGHGIVHRFYRIQWQ